MGKFVAKAVQIYKCMVLKSIRYTFEYNYVYLILFNVNRKKRQQIVIIRNDKGFCCVIMSKAQVE